MSDFVVTPQIKHDVEVTIRWGENTSKYVLPTVPHESVDVMSSLVSAIVHLEKRVCELEKAEKEFEEKR